MNKPLVSIITPCYNGGEYLDRYFSGILAQTYQSIELIFVNNGSSDNTEKKYNEYLPKLEKLGIQCCYVKIEKNINVCNGINAGLKIFQGEYLCWPDCDDWMEPACIEEKVKFLEDNKDYGAVSTSATIRKLDNINNINGYIKGDPIAYNDANQFEHLLLGNSIFCPICHMVRSAAFLDAYPNRKIFESSKGQNYQLLLPIYYKYKRGFINKPLCNYLSMANSTSRLEKDETKIIEKLNDFLNIVNNVFSIINFKNNEKDYYLNLFNKRIIYDKFYTYMNNEDSKTIKVSIKQLSRIKFKRTKLYIFLKFLKAKIKH